MPGQRSSDPQDNGRAEPPHNFSLDSLAIMRQEDGSSQISVRERDSPKMEESAYSRVTWRLIPSYTVET